MCSFSAINGGATMPVSAVNFTCRPFQNRDFWICVPRAPGTSPPATSMAEMRRIIFNDRIDAALVALFLAVVLAVLYFTIRTCIAARRIPAATAREIPAQLVPAQ